MSTKALPVILCGRSEGIGKPVIEILQPEYEVVYFTTTDEDGVVNIPLLLSGKPAQNPASTIGSANYSTPPVAVILGGGYDDENVQKFRDAIKQAPDAKKVPFLRASKQKTQQQGAEPAKPPYPGQVAARVKEILKQLKEEGKLGGAEGGDYWY